MEQKILLAAMICLGLLMCGAMVRVIKGPRFTDRIVAVNAISTMVVAVICLLSRYLEEDYLIDVAIIYALLGFVANTLLLRQLIAKKRGQKK